MLVVNKPWKDLSTTLKLNDWVMLNDKDKDWRNLVYRIGRVTAIQQMEHDPKRALSGAEEGGVDLEIASSRRETIPMKDDAAANGSAKQR